MKHCIAFLLATLFAFSCVAETGNDDHILLNLESHGGHYITGVINHAFFWNLGCKEQSGIIHSKTIARWLNQGALVYGYNIIQFYQCKDRPCSEVLPLTPYHFTIETILENQIKISPSIHNMALRDYGQRCQSQRSII